MLTWEAFAIAARDHGFRGVSARALLKAAYEAATPEQRRRGVAHATHARVRAQIDRWPNVSAEVRAVRERLLAWTGDREEVRDIRDYTSSAYAACITDYAASTSYTAACDAYYDAPNIWDGLLFICRVLDGVA